MQKDKQTMLLESCEIVKVKEPYQYQPLKNENLCNQELKSAPVVMSKDPMVK